MVRKQKNFKGQFIFFIAVVVVATALIVTSQFSQNISGGAIIAVSEDNSAAQKLASVPRPVINDLKNDIGIGGGIVDTNQPEDSFDNPTQDDDISLLQETTLKFDGGSGYDDYSAHDELWFGANSPSIQSSLSEASVDDDYGTKLALEVEPASIYYYYVFDDAIDVSAASTEDPLEIKFIGKTLKITGATASKVTVRMGETYYMNIGDELSANGHTVKVEDIVDSRAAVSVDGGAIVVIDEDDMHAWPEGVQVYVDSVFYKSGDPTKSSVNLLLGGETTKSFTDGDEYIGEEEGNEYWEWEIDNLDVSASTDVSAAGTATGPILAVKNTFSANSGSDDDPAVVMDTGCYGIPRGAPYMQLCIEELTSKNSNNMKLEVEIEDSFQISEAGGDYAELAAVNGVLAIKASNNQGLVEQISNGRTDSIYLYINNSLQLDVFYEDNNQITYAGSLAGAAMDTQLAVINYEDTKGTDITLNLQIDTDNFYLNLTANGAEIVGAVDTTSLQILNNTAFTGFGRIDHVNDNHDINIATQDEDLRTDYGIVIKDPENGISGDSIEFGIPGDAVRAKVALKSYASPTAEEHNKVISMSSGVSITEGSILVGGPAVNEFTARAMGKEFPTYGEALKWTAGWCYIKPHSLNGKTVTVIAGYSKEDTSKCVDKYLAGARNYNAVM